MERDYRFDIVRVLCMTYIVVLVHLWAYVHPDVISAFFVHPAFRLLGYSGLGLFTFASGYLLGGKYTFGKDCNTKIWAFYKKRILRIMPLFLIASIMLYLIGFNNARSTLNGMLCISPFVKPRPMTLWYIPVILICYLFTPLVCRKGFLRRFFSALGIFSLIYVLCKLVPSTDWRFQFNFFCYLVGLVSAPYFDWKFKKNPWVKLIIVFFFAVLLIITHIYSPSASYIRIFAGVGVFAILFVCEELSDIVFKKENGVATIVANISYASMACYMFHRFFFWAGEYIWNPSTAWLKWLYMAGVVFPIMLVLSFYIQKGYDKLVRSL